MTEFFLPRVFLIDDDEDDAAFFQEALNEVSPFSQLSVFSNCALALQDLMQRRVKVPDVIFLDLIMPHITGFECIEIIKQNDLLHNVPIVVLSGSIQQEQLDRLYRMGVSYFITKPPSIIDLKKLISKMVKTASVFDSRSLETFHVNREA